MCPTRLAPPLGPARLALLLLLLVELCKGAALRVYIPTLPDEFSSVLSALSAGVTANGGYGHRVSAAGPGVYETWQFGLDIVLQQKMWQLPQARMRNSKVRRLFLRRAVTSVLPNTPGYHRRGCPLPAAPSRT